MNSIFVTIDKWFWWSIIFHRKQKQKLHFVVAQAMQNATQTTSVVRAFVLPPLCCHYFIFYYYFYLLLLLLVLWWCCCRCCRLQWPWDDDDEIKDFTVITLHNNQFVCQFNFLFISPASCARVCIVFRSVSAFCSFDYEKRWYKNGKTPYHPSLFECVTKSIIKIRFDLKKLWLGRGSSKR